jgi:hypothetical protein
MMETIDQQLKAILGNNDKVNKDYPEGGFVMVDKSTAFVKYNTGDCIWFVLVDGEYRVRRIETNDDQVIDC